MLSDLVESFDPGEILLLVGHGHLDVDGLLVTLLHDLPVCKDLVGDLGEFLVLGLRDRFLLRWSHYLSNLL